MKLTCLQNLVLTDLSELKKLKVRVPRSTVGWVKANAEELEKLHQGGVSLTELTNLVIELQ